MGGGGNSLLHGKDKVCNKRETENSYTGSGEIIYKQMETCGIADKPVTVRSFLAASCEIIIAITASGSPITKHAVVTNHAVA